MKIINKEEYLAEAKQGVVVIDFFATWCGPCRVMGNILSEIEKELDGKAKVFKIDVDQEEEISREYGILSIPTIIILKDGVLQEKHIGIWQKDECVNAVKKYL